MRGEEGQRQQQKEAVACGPGPQVGNGQGPQLT